MAEIAIALQRGNADIMISAAQRQRGKARVRRRRPSTVSRHSSRSNGGGGRGVRGGGGASAEQRQLLPDSGRAMACVARLIGFSDSEPDVACRLLGCAAVDSDADTEVEDEDDSPSMPSFIPETPLREAGGQRREEEVSASQREEKADWDASVCADAVGGHCDGAQNTCHISGMVTAVATVAMAEDGMEVEEVVEVESDEVEASGESMVEESVSTG